MEVRDVACSLVLLNILSAYPTEATVLVVNGSFIDRLFLWQWSQRVLYIMLLFHHIELHRKLQYFLFIVSESFVHLEVPSHRAEPTIDRLF